jgi:hypothetical protein
MDRRLRRSSRPVGIHRLRMTSASGQQAHQARGCHHRGEAAGPRPPAHTEDGPIARSLLAESSLIGTSRVRRLVGGSGTTIRTGPMLDPDDDHQMLPRLKAEDHPVAAPTRRPTLELPLEWLADDGRHLNKRAGHELDDGRGDGLGQPRETPLSAGGDYQSPVTQRLRYRALSSSPVTTLPAVTSFWARRISAIALGSERMSRVSSRDSRSSGLMRTAAGRPFRVNTTRS